MPKSTTIQIKEGTQEWKDWRRWATRPDPGKFSALFFLTTKVLQLEDKIPMTPQAHYAMCMFAEGATGIPEIDNCRIKLIQVARGFGKSACITKGRPLQKLLAVDDYSVGIANETQIMADRFLAQIKLEFEQNDLMRALFPERIPEDFRSTTWKSDEIVIRRRRPRPVSPSCMAVGVGGTRTGTHVDEWILDDLISKNAADAARKGNFEIINNTNHWIVQLPPLLCSPERDPITVIGTPWYEGDCYEFMERYWGSVPADAHLRDFPKDFEVNWNLPLPDGTRQTIMLYTRGDIAVFKRPALHKGESIFPERWTTEELIKMRARPETAAFFSANYMLEPSAGLASAFDLEDLRYYERDATRKYIHFYDHEGQYHRIRIRDLRCFISIDPAFSDSHSAARTAIPVVGTDGTRLFLLEDFAEHGLSPDDIATKVAQFAAQYPAQEIYLETIVAQRTLVGPIKRALESVRVPPTSLIEIPSHGKRGKEMRIWGLEPWFRDNKFYIDRSHSRFLQEYSVFPRGALRDLLDAISFQVERGWERLAGQATSRDHWREREEEARARIRESVGRGGGY